MLGTKEPKAGWISPDNVRAIIDMQAQLVVYGQIAYREYLRDAPFFSDFFWTYGVLGVSFGIRGVALRGPQDRNRYH
jgi:hypothetical protein